MKKYIKPLIEEEIIEIEDICASSTNNEEYETTDPADDVDPL